MLLSIACCFLGCSSSETTSGTLGDAADETSNPGNVEYSAMCAIPTPCGGSLVGTWHHVGGCTEIDPTLGCPTAIVKNFGSVTGTMTVTADQVSIDRKLSLRPYVQIPDTCACPGTAFGGKPCLGGCLCGATYSSGSSGGGGKYTVSGTTVTIGDPGTAVDYMYCVEGTKLWLARKGMSYPELTLTRFER